MAFSVGQSISQILKPKLTHLKAASLSKAPIVKSFFFTQSQISEATNLPYNCIQIRAQHVLTSARLISLVPEPMTRQPLLQVGFALNFAGPKSLISRPGLKIW